MGSAESVPRCLCRTAQHHDPLPTGHYDAANPHHLLLGHGVSDDRQGLLADLILGRSVDWNAYVLVSARRRISQRIDVRHVLPI